LLGHAFKDRSLLLRALTHRSLLNERSTSTGHNEVLELLGDAVLSLVTVEDLLLQSPDAEEGELTERRAAHVSEEALACAADRVGLASMLRTGNSILGEVPISARADLVEALLGAVYQDGGLDAARACAKRVLGEPPLEAKPIAPHMKRELQERLQRLFGEAPRYDVERGDGPGHAPTFIARAIFRGEFLGEGTGPNKRQATEAAAAAAVAGLGHDDVTLRERFGKK
jgi:ribonuclease III